MGEPVPHCILRGQGTDMAPSDRAVPDSQLESLWSVCCTHEAQKASHSKGQQLQDTGGPTPL